MPHGPSPRILHVNRDLLRALKDLVWRGRAIHLVVQRARIALLAHKGLGTEEIYFRRPGSNFRPAVL